MDSRELKALFELFGIAADNPAGRRQGDGAAAVSDRVDQSCE